MDVNELGEKELSQLPENQVDELSQILLNTQEQCQMMDKMIKNQIQVKDEMINKLHKELEYYKQEQADRFVDQLMKALIKVHRDMGKQVNSDSWNEMSADEIRREYTYAYEDLTDLLEQQNVDSYKSTEGDIFDASKHQAFKIEQTDDLLLDKTIKKSVSEGYVKGDKVLIVERVIVYQFKG